MPKIFKEPLVQFLIGGLMLYAALAVFGPAEREDNPYIIPVNEQALLLYLQYQDKAFDTAGAKKALDALDENGRERLEQNYIRDEVLVREALALGLDTNDEVIRRRLILKMDFIVQGFTASETSFTEAEVEDFFTAHAAEYIIDASATFTHIFFSNEKHGEAAALKASEDLLSQLNQDAVPFEQAGSYGDRFYFLRNYVARPKQLITDHFGHEMTEKLFTEAPSDKWRGPFTSKYGSHLILLRSIVPEHAPKLQDVAARVLADMQRERRDQGRRTATEKLTQKYTIERSGAGI